ncbi:radical SAM methylthiotransferase, MiaB/RimO family protein [Besnoitia besnoiti]|uniref:Threonylcarbamoyladenosine tRNA methylthiotransferase n=1 Tax=Besnoitia besnoiti TaxID=94643 RepID=A0A2A9MJN0_BESBE|nr:radical SAM methylthiotransferase, MiaB/RimO family protein [Besnoitia besnoiti]PFH37384.1 radical SAM methylthiotransferase, MiaB/RimO family protein [Besnoitia besnoiti]
MSLPSTPSPVAAPAEAQGDVAALSAVAVGASSLLSSSALSSARSWPFPALALAAAIGVGCTVGCVVYASRVFGRRRHCLFGGSAEAVEEKADEQEGKKTRASAASKEMQATPGDGVASACCGRGRCAEATPCGGGNGESGCCGGGEHGCGCEARAEDAEAARDGEESEYDLEDLHSSDEDRNEAFERTRRPYIHPAQRVKQLKRATEKKRTGGGGAEAANADGGATGRHATSPEGEGGKDFFQPGKKQKIYVKTFGCAHNQSDSEYMMGVLDAAGYVFVPRMEEADLCLINSCTVKSPSEFALYSVIQEALQVEVPSAAVVRAQQRAKAARNAAEASGACGEECCGNKNDDGVGCGGSEGAEEDACGSAACACASESAANAPGEKKEAEAERAANGAGDAKAKSSHTARRRPIPCVVAGCVPHGIGGEVRDGAKKKASKQAGGEGARANGRGKRQAEQRDLIKDCSVVGVNAIDRIVEVVEEALKGNVVQLGGKRKLPSLDLPKIRRNALVEIVPISTGCLGSCTYCKTKHARGELGSYTEEAIESRIETALAEGVKQVWLTSEDSGAYGLDRGSSLTALLSRLLHGPFDRRKDPSIMLRVGMANPPFLLQQLKKAVQVFAHPNVFEFLHLPLQSGSNNVLLAMNREYTAEQFEVVVRTLLEHFPRMTIATDIICGFPGETDEDHQRTLDIIKKFKFPVVNISQFYPRPGTVAAAMKQLSSQVVKRRSREITALFESYTCYDWMLHTTQMVWFTSTSEKSPHTVGQTKQYVKVLTPRDDSLLGTCCLMHITAVEKWHVVAVRAEPTGNASSKLTA